MRSGSNDNPLAFLGFILILFLFVLAFTSPIWVPVLLALILVFLALGLFVKLVGGTVLLIAAILLLLMLHCRSRSASRLALRCKRKHRPF